MIDPSHRPPWLGPAVLVGFLYVVTGIGFAALAHSAGSESMRSLWRFAAWFVGAIFFAGHIGYEHIRRRSSPLSTAMHAAVAVALAGVGLAAWANAQSSSADATIRNRQLLALVIWPLLGAVPAFLVAFAAALAVTRLRRKQ